MKLCINCKYGPQPFSTYIGADHTSYCSHPSAPVDPVFGGKNGSFQLMRSTNCRIAACGPNGEWFEEAPPIEPIAPIAPEITMSFYDSTYGGTKPEETERDRSFWERAKKWFI